MSARPAAVARIVVTPAGAEILEEESRQFRAQLFDQRGQPIVPATPEDAPYKADLYAVDVRNGTIRPLVAQPGSDAVPEWSPDGKWIAFESQQGKVDWNYSSYLAVIPAGGGRPRYLASGFYEDAGSWPHLLAWAADSRSIYFSAYHRLGQHLFQAPLDGGPAVRVTGGTRYFDHFSLAPAVSEVSFAIEDVVTPPDAYVSSLDAVAPRKLTDLNPGRRRIARPLVDTISWRSQDANSILKGSSSSLRTTRPAGRIRCWSLSRAGHRLSGRASSSTILPRTRCSRSLREAT